MPLASANMFDGFSEHWSAVNAESAVTSAKAPKGRCVACVAANEFDMGSRAALIVVLNPSANVLWTQNCQTPF